LKLPLAKSPSAFADGTLVHPWQNPVMPTPIEAALFTQHLAAVGDAIDSALESGGFSDLVIDAGPLRLAFLDDHPYSFQPNPHFVWLVPVLNAPDSLICWRPGRKPLLLLVIPNDFWHVPPTMPTGDWTRHFEIQAFPNRGSAVDALPSPGNRRAWISEFPPPGQPSHNPDLLLRRLHHARSFKTAYEVACIRAASRTAVAGHRAAQAAFAEGLSEFEIHMAYLSATVQNDAELPYGSIVALNGNGATLHYQLRSRGRPEQSRSLLIDAGATHLGYASDITRTHAAQPGLFADLVIAMHNAQQSLCAAVRPAVEWRDLHLESHRQVAQILCQAGVLLANPDEAVASGLTSTFLPHGLGHLLGIQVHDVAGFRNDPEGALIEAPPGHEALRLTRTLKAGFVVTVEPGIYFIDSLLNQLRTGALATRVEWRLVDALRPFGGIRIEDDVLVTSGGHENLTREAFAS
jgi:Xaa-Pro dipeptidase